SVSPFSAPGPERDGRRTVHLRLLGFGSAAVVPSVSTLSTSAVSTSALSIVSAAAGRGASSGGGPAGDGRRRRSRPTVSPARTTTPTPVGRPSFHQAKAPPGGVCTVAACLVGIALGVGLGGGGIGFTSVPTGPAFSRSAKPQSSRARASPQK